MIHDISYLNDVELRHYVKKEYNYCNIDYNTRKKHLKTGDTLDKSKMLSAFNKRQEKRKIHNEIAQKRYVFIDTNNNIICYTLEKNIIEIANKLRKQQKTFKIAMV